MNAIVDWLFGTATFIPHGMCLLWRPDLVAIHAVSDLLISAAYFVIPLVLWRFIRARPDLHAANRRLATLFLAFILACGLTHLVGLLTLWEPVYGFQAMVKAATAVISVTAAAAAWRLVPRLTNLPPPGALQDANERLRAEVAAHQQTLLALQASRDDLERLVAERTEDLRVANTRFEKALSNSNIVVTEQNAALEYTWAFNVGTDLLPDDPVGRRLTDLAPAGPAAEVERFKARTLASGEAQREVFDIVLNDRLHSFDMKVEPVVLRSGERGLITTTTDISDLKAQQRKLQLVMRELNHRSKNLLAIVQAIARQTAISEGVAGDFTQRLGQRLQALAKAHDVLVEQDWQGADLGAVAEGQIGHLLASMPGRIAVSGEACGLPPESAHYLALALHELGANAVKYGALSGHRGAVALSWEVEITATGRELRLEWREADGPAPTAPARRGFGRLLLETLAPSALNGKADLTFEAEGLRWVLRCPLPRPA